MVTQVIDSFSGEYRFLSNFYPAEFELLKIIWRSSEHAYQAFKTRDSEVFLQIQQAPTPGKAKRLGGKAPLREDWDTIKLDVMRKVLRAKFSLRDLRKKLLETGDALLVEGNHWGDTFWGVCRGHGQNWLGRLLMELRTELRSVQALEDLNAEAQALGLY